MKKAGLSSILIAVVLLALGVTAQAQQQAKTFKVGWLESATTDRGSRLGEIFLRRLAELGFVEGKNITFEYRSADNKLDRLPALVDELVRLNVDVLLTSATPATIAAKELGLQLHSMEVSSADQFEGAFKEAIKARSGALAVTPMVLASNHRKEIVELAAKSRLPAVYYRDSFVESGGLMSYGADLADHFRRAADFIEKILKGSKPADLPVEQPTKFELLINLKAAKQIGLTIPPNVLARADKVIK